MYLLGIWLIDWLVGWLVDFVFVFQEWKCSALDTSNCYSVSFRWTELRNCRKPRWRPFPPWSATRSAWTTLPARKSCPTCSSSYIPFPTVRWFLRFFPTRLFFIHIWICILFLCVSQCDCSFWRFCTRWWPTPKWSRNSWPRAWASTFWTCFAIPRTRWCAKRPPRCWQRWWRRSWPDRNCVCSWPNSCPISSWWVIQLNFTPLVNFWPYYKLKNFIQFCMYRTPCGILRKRVFTCSKVLFRSIHALLRLIHWLIGRSIDCSIDW